MHIIAAISHLNLLDEIILQESQLLSNHRTFSLSSLKQIFSHLGNIRLLLLLLGLLSISLKYFLLLIIHIARPNSINTLLSLLDRQHVMHVFVKNKYLVKLSHLFQTVTVKLARLRKVTGF